MRSTQMWNTLGRELLFAVFLRQHPIRTLQVASAARHAISVFAQFSI